MQSEKSEMLEVYDENLNKIGLRTRADVHANELLHQTVRVWAVERDDSVQGGRIWFQQRSYDKALFPGRFDQAATGHMDPGEKPLESALRETREETGLDLGRPDLAFAGAMPFPFRRPDGKLDNEFANVYLYMPESTPKFQLSDEVVGLASIGLKDYDKLVRDGGESVVDLYRCRPDDTPEYVRSRPCGPDDFCCLNQDEWDLIKDQLGGLDRQARRLPDLSGIQDGIEQDGLEK